MLGIRRIYNWITKRLRNHDRWERACIALSEATDWLSLSSIGKSRVVALTIVVPFIGYLILFNNYIFEYFMFAKEVVRASHPFGNFDSIQGNISLNNLYFLYFGLVLVGLSSSLFSIFCPNEIKQNRTVNDFIRSSEEIKAATLVIDDLNYVLAKYVNANEPYESNPGEEADAETPQRSLTNILEYPDDIGTMHYHLTYEIYDRMQQLDPASDDPQPPEDYVASQGSGDRGDYSDDSGGDAISGMIYGSGYLNIYGISEIALMNRRVHFYSVRLFRQAANDFYKDISFIKFACLRREKPHLRIAIGASYALGFILLLIPTLKTCFLIASSFFN